MTTTDPAKTTSGAAVAAPVDRPVMAPVPEREFECLGDPAICDNPRGCGCAPTPERTYTRAELLTALAAERHACSIVVWMTLMEALEPDADDKGLDGWMREAELRVKNRQYEHDAMELGRELYADAQDAVGRLSARVQELEATEEGAKEAFGVVVQEKRDMRSMTPWFPVAVDPVHEGIYEVEYRQSRFTFRREWRDGLWCIPGAVMLPATRPKRWRGLTAPARTMPKDQ